MTDTITPGHASLAAALAAFQAELPKLIKGETAKVTGENAKTGAKVSYSYGYAGLDQVVEAVLPALGKNGLAISSKTVISDGGFMLEVALMHEKGEREIGYWPLPDPRRSGPQEIGSAMTYGRRYLTLALTGTFPGGEDDDGAKAQTYAQQERWDNAKPQRADKPVSAPPAPEKDWSKASDAEILELHHKIETLPIGQAVSGYDWMASLNLHKRKVEIPTDEGPQKVDATDVLAYRFADVAAKPTTTLDDLEYMTTAADTRGLMKIMVSADTTLGEELGMAREVLHSQAKETTEAVMGAGD